MSLYDILVFGCEDISTRDAFVDVLKDLIVESGLLMSEVRFLTDPSGYLNTRNPRTPTVAACFSKPSQDELAVLTVLLHARMPIIPIARPNEKFENFPILLRPLNGTLIPHDKGAWGPTAITVLDSVGLLRAQRRLFISYRRTESRDTAVQLHDELSGRGFQVFLDTHSIRPGKVFQDNLWHSLCDSDVMIMLDTATYFKSKWTREEFGRSLSMGINILRLIWPGHTPEQSSELSEKRILTDTDFNEEVLKPDILEEIAEKVELLRARGLAARHTEMTGKLKTGIESIGATICGTGAYRSMSIKLKDGREAWVYPVIGVPTANMMHDVALRAQNAKHAGPYMVYDHTGITSEWLEHLGWLDQSIPDVDVMRVSEAAGILAKRPLS